MKWMMLLVLTLSFFAEAKEFVTLKSSSDLKALVEKQNKRVRAKDKLTEASKQRTGSFARSFLPKLELYAGQETFEKAQLSARTQPTYGAELRLNVFNGGIDRLEEDRRSLTAERMGFEQKRMLAEEVARAREAYWRILYLRDYRELLDSASKINQESLKAAVRRIKGGVGSQTDRVEFEMQDIDLKREKEQAQLEQQNHIRSLKVILGLPDGTELQFAEELLHEHNWEAVVEHTEKDHAFLVKPDELYAKEAEKLSSIQKRAWLPKLDAFAAYNQLNQREEDEYPNASDRTESVIGLMLTMDLSSGLVNQNESAALSLESAAAKAQADYVRDEIEAHLHGELEELKLLHDQVHDAETNIQRAERYYKLTQSEYSRGVKNSPDVLGATQKLVQMKQKRLEIIRDFQISKAHVMAKMGR